MQMLFEYYDINYPLTSYLFVLDYKKLANEVGGLKTTEPKNVEKDMKKLLE